MFFLLLDNCFIIFKARCTDGIYNIAESRTNESNSTVEDLMHNAGKFSPRTSPNNFDYDIPQGMIILDIIAGTVCKSFGCGIVEWKWTVY